MAFLTAREVLEQITVTDAEKIQDVDGAMLFELSGEESGLWTVIVADGRVELQQGETAPANVIFNMDGRDLVAIANGELNPINAFMQGRVKVKGDMKLAIQLQNLLA